MASSASSGFRHRGARAPFVCAALLAASCSPVGRGEGDISGTLEIDSCHAKGDYNLDPSAFFAQSVEELLRIRVQRGSDLEVRSDGIALLIEDATRVKTDFLGQELDVSPDSDPRIDVSLYLNDTCPPGRDRTPVVLGAIRGTIRFEQIYAPEVDEDDVSIEAYLDGVRFQDARNEERWAELSGYFKFLYVRGRPGQRFP